MTWLKPGFFGLLLNPSFRFGEAINNNPAAVTMIDLKLTALKALRLLGGCIADLFGAWDTEFLYDSIL